jgi:flagellar biosynthesis/type III secretory pathway chaperone
LENTLLSINQVLKKLIGSHRQLLDVVREEKACLVQADLSKIQAATRAKEGIIEEILRLESDRLKLLTELSVEWKKPLKDLTLSQLVIAIQGTDPQGAEQFRSNFNVLTVLIQRITEQNQESQALMERSLVHIRQMNQNVLGEATAKSSTYTQQGHRSAGIKPPRYISKEI